MQPTKKQTTSAALRILIGLLAVIALVALVAAVAAYWYFYPHSRSINAYCQQYRTIESSFDHGAYKAAGLSADTTGDLAEGFVGLERHAPGAIRPDLKLLAGAYKKLDTNPAYGPTIEEGTAIQQAGNHVREWNVRECNQVKQ